MKRSDLTVGMEVAVITHGPVPRDPYDDFTAKRVHRVVVVRPHAEDGNVEVMMPTLRTTHLTTPRSIIAPWDDYEAIRDERSLPAVDRRRQRRLDAEARALSVAQRRWPGATLSQGCIVIEVGEFLAGSEA